MTVSGLQWNTRSAFHSRKKFLLNFRKFLAANETVFSRISEKEDSHARYAQFLKNSHREFPFHWPLIREFPKFWVQLFALQKEKKIPKFFEKFSGNFRTCPIRLHFEGTVISGCMENAPGWDWAGKNLRQEKGTDINRNLSDLTQI